MRKDEPLVLDACCLYTSSSCRVCPRRNQDSILFEVPFKLSNENTNPESSDNISEFAKPRHLPFTATLLLVHVSHSFVHAFNHDQSSTTTSYDPSRDEADGSILRFALAQDPRPTFQKLSNHSRAVPSSVAIVPQPHSSPSFSRPNGCSPPLSRRSPGCVSFFSPLPLSLSILTSFLARRSVSYEHASNANTAFAATPLQSIRLSPLHGIV